MDDRQILVLVEDEQIKGKKAASKIEHFSEQKLTKALSTFIDAISKCMENTEPKVTGFQLDEIELKVEISAEGEIHLIGTATLGGSGGLSLKFKRRGN